MFSNRLRHGVVSGFDSDYVGDDHGGGGHARLD